MKKIVLFIALIFTLAACESTKTAKCTINEPYKSTYEFTLKGDILASSVVTNEYNLVSMGVTSDDFKKLVEDVKKSYDVKGITYKIDIKSDIAKEEITIDMEKASNKDLYNIGISKDPKAEKLSYKKTKESLEPIGYKCTELK